MMAVIECKKCGAEFDTQAKACPKCGAPASAPPDRLTLVVLAVLLGLGVVLLFTPEPTRNTD
jgi:hypothetical protein